MNPLYQITSEILKLITSISEKIGQINVKFVDELEVYPKIFFGYTY